MVNCKDCQYYEKCDFEKVAFGHVNSCRDFKAKKTTDERRPHKSNVR